MNRRHLFSVCALAAACASQAFAQAFPSKPVRIVIGFPAGGPLDQHARLLSDKLQKELDDIGKKLWLSCHEREVLPARRELAEKSVKRGNRHVRIGFIRQCRENGIW